MNWLIVFLLAACVFAVTVAGPIFSESQTNDLEIQPENQAILDNDGTSIRKARGLGFGGVGVQVGLLGVGVGGYPGTIN